MTTLTELITPELAAKLLQGNTSNRKLNKTTVRKYSSYMSDGEWRYNGVPIIISTDGRLIDGQHRLQAIIISGESIEMDIKTGVIFDDAFHTIDCGKVRDLSDLLSIDGDSSYTVKRASLIKKLAVLEYSPENTTSQIKMDKRTEKALSNEELLNIENLYGKDNIIDAVKYIGKNNAASICNSTVLAFCYFVIARKNPEKADEFFDLLGSGEGLKNGSPILALRERLILIRINRKISNNSEVARMIFHAWNKWRRGLSLKSIRTEVMKDLGIGKIVDSLEV